MAAPVMLRRWVAALTAAALTLLPAIPAPAQADTILFGAAVSFTGSLAKEGRLTREGYDFWKDYVNEHGGLRVGGKSYHVDINYYDDESNPQTAAHLVERLIDENHVNFILGPYGSATSFAVAAVAERKGIPMVEGNGAAEKIFNQGYRYTFAVLSPARKYLAGIIEFATKRTPRPTSVAITATDEAFSLEIQQGAIELANDHGLHVVYSARYPVNATDVSTIVAAVKASGADMILNAGHLQDALLMHRTLKDQGVQAKIYGYSVGPDTPDFRDTLGRDANYVYGSAQWSDVVKYHGAPGFYGSSAEYARAFTRAVGHAPDYHNAESTATCLAFQYAIQHAGTLEPSRVRDALASLDVVTFFGLLKFDSRGLNVFKPMVVNQIQNGKLVTVYPYRLAAAQPMYPTPAWGSR
jgi:branched-chain amino acid transport system substrate-binding protein